MRYNGGEQTLTSTSKRAAICCACPLEKGRKLPVVARMLRILRVYVGVGLPLPVVALVLVCSDTV